MFRTSKTKQAPRCGRGRVAITAGIGMMVLVALAVAVYGRAILYPYPLIGDEGGNGSPMSILDSPAIAIPVSDSNMQIPGNTQTSKSKPVSIFYVGNSILQVNQTPRFMQYLRNAAQGDQYSTKWSAFLRGGKTLATLVKSGMNFGHIPNLDYVIMNDQTQTPARAHTRYIVIKSMILDYLPMFQSSGATPVFVVTAAYRAQVMGSADLGSVEQFTNSLAEGYEIYAAQLEQRLPASQKPILAPVGLAYYQVHQEQPELWKKLFAWDSYHPSAQGTFLQCCVLYRSIFGELPPKNVAVQETDQEVQNLWKQWMNPQDRNYSPPTIAEAEYLWEVAGRVVDGFEKKK
jgi:hypothetical protein